MVRSQTAGTQDALWHRPEWTWKAAAARFEKKQQGLLYSSIMLWLTCHAESVHSPHDAP